MKDIVTGRDVAPPTSAARGPAVRSLALGERVGVRDRLVSGGVPLALGLWRRSLSPRTEPASVGVRESFIILSFVSLAPGERVGVRDKVRDTSGSLGTKRKERTNVRAARPSALGRARVK